MTTHLYLARLPYEQNCVIFHNTVWNSQLKFSKTCKENPGNKYLQHRNTFKYTNKLHC